MSSSYMNRAMRSADPRFVTILSRLGHKPAQPRIEAEVQDDLPALRAEYERVVGKRPFMGWDAEALRQKMAEATEGDDE